MGRRVQHHRNHRLGQRLPFMLARCNHSAELAHDRVKGIVHGHAHRHRGVDRCLLRLGPHPLLADLLVAGTPAAVTLAATAPSVHHRLPGPAPPACIPNQVAKATPARLTIVVR